MPENLTKEQIKIYLRSSANIWKLIYYE
jgi:hypothetical protein